MLPALSISDINKYCNYEYKQEKKIVGIMIARYSLPKSQKMIKEQYDFWHFMTGKDLNVYWLGYGAYYFPGKAGQYLVGNYGNQPNVYFDTNIFTRGIKELEQYKDIHDEIGILLCNYYDNKIHLDESVFFNLENLMKDSNSELRKFADYLICLCKNEDDVSKITVKLKIKYEFLDIKPTKMIIEIIKTIVGVGSGLF